MVQEGGRWHVLEPSVGNINETEATRSETLIMPMVLAEQEIVWRSHKQLRLFFCAFSIGLSIDADFEKEDERGI